MALYSWFSEAKNNQSDSRQLLNKELKKTTIKNKYLESYTMWPVAKVIQGQQVTPPQKNNLAIKKNEKTLRTSSPKTSLCTVLTVKSTGNTI